jgi:predicted AAA+ superfamily ATPase
MRYFNTSGPNIVAEHYTLMRPELVAEGRLAVHRSRYLTIWAPRQTGKSTYFKLLSEVLTAEGYKVAQLNFENYRNAKLDDFETALSEDLTRFWQYDFKGKSMQGVFQEVKNVSNEKWVLIVDEVEGINATFFGDFLHSIRNVYHSREWHSLKSVILVGVSNIVGVVQDNASPFNIADNLNVPYFTTEETYELLGQHEAETGQLFGPSVKMKLAEMTANQPGLVNGFARLLVERTKEKPVISLDDYKEVEDWYLTEAIDKNVSNIINKAQEYRAFVERLLFTETKVKFLINRPDIKLLFVNGIIKKDEDGNVTFRVPVYQKCLYTAFYPYLNGEKDRIRAETDADLFLTADGHLDLEKLVNNYKVYAARRGFRYFREKDAAGNFISLKEAALMYSFDTYINAIVNLVGGKTYLEPTTALGRSDLLINYNGHEYVVETKIYSDTVQFADGKKQLAYYLNSLKLTWGIYLVFVRSTIDNPKIIENVEMINGVQIRTHIVRYDLSTDFKKPKKKRRGDEDDDDD